MDNETLITAVRMVGHLLEHHPTTGTSARTEEQDPCYYDDSMATSWCLVGARALVARHFSLPVSIDSPFGRIISDVVGCGFNQVDAWEGRESTYITRLNIARKLQAYNGH